LLEEVRAVSVSFIRLFINIESLRESAGGSQIKWLSGLKEKILGAHISREHRPMGNSIRRWIAKTKAISH
jgi:hypothetical protein